MEEHASAEDSEDHINLPTDVCKSRWHEVGECKVEDPVGGRAQCNGLTSNAQGEELRWVNPGNWAPCGCVRGHEEVGARDDCLCRRASDRDRLCRTVELAPVWFFSVDCENASIDGKEG